MTPTDDEQYRPDIFSRFIFLKNSLEELSNQISETLGENHFLSLKTDLVWARCLDLVDSVEELQNGTYD